MLLLEVPHPFGGQSLFGRLLMVGEKVEKGDRYASTDGTWNPPGNSVGITIESRRTVWVRPAKATSGAHPRAKEPALTK